MTTQSRFEGPSGEMRSNLGRYVGETMHMTTEEEKAAREAVADLLEMFRKLGPMKEKELIHEVMGLRHRLNEAGFEDALRAKMALYGVVIGKFPHKPHEATREEIRERESNAPLTANMEERIAMLEDAVMQAEAVPEHPTGN